MIDVMAPGCGTCSAVGTSAHALCWSVESDREWPPLAFYLSLAASIGSSLPIMVTKRAERAPTDA